ncbi:MAG: type II secretion system protein N [Gallionella sp.]
MSRILLWLFAGIISIAITTLAFLPASWMASLIETRSAGRLSLGDAQGTIWNGSAFIGGAAGRNGPVTPLLPGRFSWQLSPMVLLGSVNMELNNTAALSQPMSITGSWRNVQISPSSISLPAERLAALGAPLNTIQPSGKMRLSWTLLQLETLDGTASMKGSMNLGMHAIASRLSPVKPLGDYNLAVDWLGQYATVKLSTIKGPMLLSGTGKLINGRLQFSGQAEAESGHKEKLANFLNLLGQHRIEGNRKVIALEF